MGTRVTAHVPDPRRGRISRAIREAWRGLPGDLLGAGAARLAGARSRRTVDAVDGDGRLLCRAIVVEDRRLGRWLDAVPLAPVAMTFGRYVLARQVLAGDTLRHELEHVRQWSRLGPMFLPAYLLESLVAGARGADRYRGNRFEIAARARESPTARVRTAEATGSGASGAAEA